MLPRRSSRRTWRRLARVAVLALAVPACARPERVDGDVSVLRAALADWQEGPGDGRVCLDPRALAGVGETGARWSDAVLRGLLADTLVALDTSRVAPGGTGRWCDAARVPWVVALAPPTMRADTAEVRSAALLAATPGDSARVVRGRVLLVRDRDGWRIVARPDMTFRVLVPGA